MMTKSGWVYVIQCGDFPYFKIGVSQCSAKSRLDSLQTGSPFELKLILQAHVEDGYNTERRLHNKFADRWRRGEWFTIDALSLIQLVHEIEKFVQDSTKIKAGDINVMFDHLKEHTQAQE
jgi:hypothetical protein